MSVLIGTKVKDAEIWLPRFINQVESLEGDIAKIVVMYGESRDKSYGYLDHWRNTSRHKVELYADPYLPPEERHGAMLARVKKEIQKQLELSSCDYYLNLDCDLVDIPSNSIQRFMEADKDLIAGMVWTERREPRTFFDVYVYRKDGARFHPLRPPGLGESEPFMVDSVSTFYLAKTEVELAGEYVNPHPHIPFCADLRRQGYTVWVHPAIHATHIDLEALGIGREVLPIPLSQAPYIDRDGRKWTPEQVGAQLHHLARTKYRIKTMETNPEQMQPVLQWLNKRPLLTASYKLWTEEEWIEASLDSVYSYVDRIDVAYGAVNLRRGEEPDNTLSIVENYPDPDDKIRIISQKWRSKEEIQRKLLEICSSQWMLFIDGDEVIDGMEHVRSFVSQPRGNTVYARPKRFLNYWHDTCHIAYSLNPLTPWAKWGLPHPFLIWRDIPGLNFSVFHTLPMDGFGIPIDKDDPSYKGRTKILENVFVHHFGNAKKKQLMTLKSRYEHERGTDPPVDESPWFTGVMPPDMVIESYTGPYPEALKNHPRLGEEPLIEVTKRKPHYKFRRIVNGR